MGSTDVSVEVPANDASLAGKQFLMVRDAATEMLALTIVLNWVEDARSQ